MTSTPAPAAPPPSPRSDVARLFVLLLVAAAVHWWVVANTVVTARDSIGFARYALSLGDPDRPWAEVLRAEAHPPGYPLAVLTAHELLPPSDRPLTDRILLAAQVASSVAGVLVVFPVYWLGRRLFDRSVGFWAALLLQLLPVFARDTADGLSDGPFLLCVLSALACGVWALDRPRVWAGLLACGVLSGLAYLIRPEGGLMPAAAGLALLLRAGRVGFGNLVCGGLALAVGFLAVSGPYMTTIGGFTNKPAFKAETAAVPGAVGGPLFARSIPPDVSAGQRGLLTAQTVCEEWLKAGHYGVAAFAVVGLLLTLRRVRREPHFWLPVLYSGGQLIAVTALGFKKGYVSERHLLPVAAVGTVFAVGGLTVWFGLWAKVPAVGRVFAWRWWPSALCAALAVVGAVPVFTTRLHADRAGHMEAGPKLAEAIAALPPDWRDGVVVLDHYQWCQFFSGRATAAIPPDPPPEKQRVVFAVLEGKEEERDGVRRWVPEDPDFGSERHQMAVRYYLSPPPGSAVDWVHHWPPGPREQAKMALVKIAPPPK